VHEHGRRSQHARAGAWFADLIEKKATTVEQDVLRVDLDDQIGRIAEAPRVLIRDAEHMSEQRQRRVRCGAQRQRRHLDQLPSTFAQPIHFMTEDLITRQTAGIESERHGRDRRASGG
jgi:hypothetical protein